MKMKLITFIIILALLLGIFLFFYRNSNFNCPIFIEKLGNNSCDIFKQAVINCKGIVIDDVDNPECPKNISIPRLDYISVNYPLCYNYFNKLENIVKSNTNYSIALGSGCSDKNIGYLMLQINENFTNSTILQLGDMITYIKFLRNNYDIVSHRVIYVDSQNVITETDSKFTADIIPNKPIPIINKAVKIFVLSNFTGWKGQYSCDKTGGLLDCVMNIRCPDSTGINCIADVNMTDCYERITRYRNINTIQYCGVVKVNQNLVEYVN